MKKGLLTTIIVSIALCGTTVAATSSSAVHRGREQGIRLTAKQQQTIEAVQGKAHNMKRVSKGSSLVPIKKSNLSMGTHNPMRMSESGSTIQGFMKSSWDEADNGWYELLPDGVQKLKWKYAPEDWNYEDGEPEFPFNCGFIRKGNVYALESFSFFGYAFLGHGIFSLDGDIIEFEEDLYDDFSQYTFSCAYNPEEDTAYAYTINSDATGYMFQKINPETWDFTVIDSNVEIEDVCIAFTWCLEDSKLYGVTTEGKLVNVGEDGTLTLIRDLGLPATSATCGFTYSPIDSQFSLVYSADLITDLYIIDYPEYTVKHSATLDYVLQYPILVCADSKFAPEAPRTPIINHLIFDNGSTDGKVSLTMPSQNYGGQNLTAQLTVECRIDNNSVLTFNAEPGGTSNFQLNNIKEGKHLFSFLCKIGNTEGSAAERELFVGFDTPFPPEGVSIETGLISWKPYQDGCAGINGGYIDVENLRFNVFLNDKQINDTPVEGTSFSFSTPDVDYSTFIAGVEAINHGHVSDIRYSDNTILGGKGLDLPLSMPPTQEQANLFESYPEYSWFYSPYEECFLTDTYGWNDEENWLLLPKINIPSNQTLVKVSFDALIGSNSSECVTLYALESADISTAAEIKKFILTDNENFSNCTAMFAPASQGELFIALKVKTWDNGALMGVNNFTISMTDVSSKVPAECFDIIADPYEFGELKAKINLTLPVADATGNLIDAETTLTANVVSPAGTASVNGKPGESVSVDVTTVQGFNDIVIFASSVIGTGITSNIRVFTGIDIPMPLTDIIHEVTKDNMSVTLTWEAPEKGINGGYVSPDLITYALCLRNDEGYAYIATELGNTTTYTYRDENNPDMHLCELGILSQTVAGNAGTVRFTNVALGKPYSLPMNETFDAIQTPENNYSAAVYNPILGQIPDSDYGECLGVSYLGFLPDTPIEGYGIYGYAPEAGDRGRIELPKFSTEDLYSAAIEMTVYCGDLAGKFEVFAKSFETEYIKIGEAQDNSFFGWKRFRFMLPESLANMPWVQIAIDAVFDNEDQMVGISQYRISNVNDYDLSISKVLTGNYGVAGESIPLSVEITNNGTMSVNPAGVKAEVFKDGKIIQTVFLEENESSELEPLTDRCLFGKWIPSAQGIGEVKIVYSIIDQDDYLANNNAEKSISISQGNGIIIDNLEAYESDNNSVVTLTWSEPAIADAGFEGFENYNSFSILDKYGDFNNFDADGLNELYFAMFNLPGQWNPKAWQIIGTKEVSAIMEEEAGETNTYFAAATGDKFAASFTPYEPLSGSGTTAENWLISPELIPGSQFSIRLANLSGYQDDVTIMVSQDRESFSELEVISLSKGKWEEFNFTLPEGALYFAIVASSEADYGFVVLLDDITFKPANSVGSISGYDIYRNGTLIAENVTASGLWIDNMPCEGEKFYYIVPIINEDGNYIRGIQSNTVFTGHSDITELKTSTVSVSSRKEGIVVKGGNGSICQIATPDGMTVLKISISSDYEFINLKSGIYLVSIGNSIFKTIVK